MIKINIFFDSSFQKQGSCYSMWIGMHICHFEVKFMKIIILKINAENKMEKSKNPSVHTVPIKKSSIIYATIKKIK